MDSIGPIFVLILIVAYLFLYISGRYYLREGYTNPELMLKNNVPPPPPAL